ncbi:MAG: hypothetical protein J07HX5_01238 [halophilic archaeon J07HX5]|jgi:hypothetical protein|nr:MAG: hypothetical protein J07HX5_01238 [halophilic archaeon J07HX5]
MTIGNAEQTKTGPSLRALAKVVIHKKLVLLLRYPVNTGTQFITMIIFFILIFFGGQQVAGPGIDDSLNGIIVGFLLFTLTTVAYSSLSYQVTREAQWGTLERLYISPHGFGTVMGLKTIVNVIMSFCWGLLLLVVMMGITGRWLTLDPLIVVPLVVLALMSVVGVGFLFAGLAIVYKRIENLFQIVQFSFVGLIAAPVGQIEWLKLLPLTHESYFLRRAMEDGIPLWEVPQTELGLMICTSVVYLVAGYYCFYRASITARKRGVMGHY